MATIRIVDAARNDTCRYPASEIMLASNAFMRATDYEVCGKEAQKLIIVQDSDDRRAYCPAHLGPAARVMRRMEVK